MSSPFPGFVGPSYQLEDRYAAIERTVNWYLTANESAEEAKFKLALAPSPGNAPFGPVPVPAPFNQPNRGLLYYREIVYGVNGTVAFALNSFGGMVVLGIVADDHQPVSMVGNGTGQVGIASAGHFYVVTAATLAFAEVPITEEGFLGSSFLTFQDGYVLSIVPNSNKFQISGTDATPVGDMSLWSAANIAVMAGQQDYLRGIISSREYIRILGQRRSQVYQNVGNQGIGGFPFQNYNETFIETGIAAPFSLADLGDSLIWIGEDARGQRACWVDPAFQPQRASTFAVEQFWQQYPTIADAVAFPFIWMGHLMYQVTFPTADKTWVYDVTVSRLIGRHIWHERSYTSGIGVTGARPERFHAFAWGKHLVGSSGSDGNPGAIYQYVWPAAILAQDAEPQLLLRWSNDAGNTWGPEYNIPTGKVGEYGTRAYMNRCGYARDRVFWTRLADSALGSECGVDFDGNQIQVPIVRDRIAPHLYQGNKRVIYNRIEFDLARGTGLPGIVGAELDFVVCAS